MYDKFEDANRKLRGRLAWQVRRRRERNDSYQEIAFWLRTQGVNVSHETVRRWYQRILDGRAA